MLILGLKLLNKPKKKDIKTAFTSGPNLKFTLYQKRQAFT